MKAIFENLLDSVSPEEADRLAREGKAERRKEGAIALVMGDIHSAPPLVRIHSQCLTGDVFHSMRCDCRQQLELALSMIAEAGAGILIYEQQEGRGIGLMAKLQAYELQDQGLDTVEANVELGYDNDYRAVHAAGRDPAAARREGSSPHLKQSREGRGRGERRNQSRGTRVRRCRTLRALRKLPPHQKREDGAFVHDVVGKIPQSRRGMGAAPGHN